MNSNFRFSNYLYHDDLEIIKFITLNNKKNILKDLFSVYIVPKRIVLHKYWLFCILGKSNIFNYNYLICNFYKLNMFNEILYFYKSKYLFNYKYIKYDFKNIINYVLYASNIVLKYNFYILNLFKSFLINHYFKFKLFLLNFLFIKYFSFIFNKKIILL